VLSYEADGWGVGEVWLQDNVLLNHELPRARSSRGLPAADGLAGRFRAFFAGEQDAFADVELDLEWCTPFQRAVVSALRAVLRGETVTYGELAALAGYPSAARAVGSVCAGNRFPLVVPCHRVVAANGLGPYGLSGQAYKRRLLELEANIGTNSSHLEGQTPERRLRRIGTEL